MNLRKRTIAAITAGAAALGGVGGYVAPDGSAERLERIEELEIDVLAEADRAQYLENELEDERELAAERAADLSADLEIAIEDANEVRDAYELLRAEVENLRERGVTNLPVVPPPGSAFYVTPPDPDTEIDFDAIPAGAETFDEILGRANLERAREWIEILREQPTEVDP